MKREIRPSTKPISARVNRAAWDWLEMNGANKNQTLNQLLELFVSLLQHNEQLALDYFSGHCSVEDILIKLYQ
jgi:hypothetical protein